jgi:hypothetical protein
MKVVYIAGPFRGNTPWDVERNIRSAEREALAVAFCGGVPLCPHTMYRFYDKLLSDEFWIEATEDLLRRCDALVLCPGWHNSAGSRGEEKVARKEMKIPIFPATEEGYKDLRKWLGEESTHGEHHEDA